MQLFLGALISALDVGQRKAVLDMLQKLRREGKVRTQEELEAAIKQLLESLSVEELGEPTFRPLPADSSLVTSDSLNRLYQQYFVDLYGLYENANQVATTLVNHEILQSGVLEQAKDGLRKLATDLRIHRFLKANPNFTDVKLVDFGSGQVGRNKVTGAASAVVDPEVKTLRLRERSRQQIDARKGSMEPQVTSEVLSAGTPFTSQSFSPEKALDARRDSFWTEIVLADRPLQTQYKNTTYQGIVAQISIALPRLSFVNEISILPFAEFPLTLIDVETSEDQGSTWSTVSGFSAGDPTTDWVETRTPREGVTNVRLTLHQESFVDRVFLIPRAQVAHALLWDQIIQAHFQEQITESELDAHLVREAETDSATKSYINQLAKLDQDIRRLQDAGDENADLIRQMRAITKSVVELDPDSRDLVLRALGADTAASEDQQQQFLELRKVEYGVGALRVGIADVGFEPVSVYRSPRFKVSSDLTEVALDVDEAHTEVDGSQVSSVEYTVEVAPKRRVNLVPTRTTSVTELVEVDPRVRQGELRLTPASTPNLSVTANGQALDSSDFTLSGQSLTIDKSAFRRGHRYVATYDIASGQDSADITGLFDSKPIESPELFDRTEADGSLQLRQTPFVAMEIINGTLGTDPSWFRPDSKKAVYVFRQDQDPVTIDGVSYGKASDTLSGTLNKSATSFSVTSGASFPSDGGVIEITDGSGVTERMRYSSYSGSTFSGVTRSIEGTPARNFNSGDTVKLRSKLRYEPLEVTVDGIKARNMTNYLTGVQPAFIAPDPRQREHRYIQVGRALYFSDRIQGKRISVQYNSLAQYLQLQAVLRNNEPVVHSVTPEISEYKLKLKQGSLQ